MSLDQHQHHVWKDTLLFQAKACLFRLKRLGENTVFSRPRRWRPTNRRSDSWNVVAESISPLRTDTNAKEAFLTTGKIQNLRRAARNLNGLEIPAGGLFSFWKQVGFPSRFRGFVEGRELREGCLIPNIGGGLCQLSNALYDAALKAGLEIVERHAHSQIVPGSLAEMGRDATVFWNYVDLRFRPSSPVRIEARLTSGFLEIAFLSPDLQPAACLDCPTDPRSSHANSPQSCASCGIQSCFRHVDELPTLAPSTARAFLLDRCTPEFNNWVKGGLKQDDHLFIPLDGARYRKANYAWATEPTRHLHQARWLTLKRALGSRRLASQGAARQRSLLQFSRQLAASYAGRLPWDIEEVVVSQDLLPFLWRDGHLGGRRFSVLMTRLPLTVLQSRLNEAAALHPESPTLADFRVDEGLLAVEDEALQSATRIISAHRDILRHFPVSKHVALPWHLPHATVESAPDPDLPVVIFPASTLGRKGAYELREALRGLSVRLVPMGGMLEGESFWKGLQTEVRPYQKGWLEGASVVVLPSWVEHEPRRLLEALAAGVPVIASTACGLAEHLSLTEVAPGDVRALRVALENSSFLARSVGAGAG